MMTFRTIRARLTFWYTSLVTVTLIFSGFTSYYLTRAYLYDDLDQFLRNEVSWLRDFAEPRAKEISEQSRQTSKEQANPTRSLGAGKSLNADFWREVFEHTLPNTHKLLVEILDRNGNLLYQSPFLRAKQFRIDNVPLNTIGLSTVHDETSGDLRVAILQTANMKILAAYQVDYVQDILGNIVTVRLFLSPIIILIALLGGLALAHRLLKPVNDLARTVEKITAQNLKVQLPVVHAEDEVGRLTKTFNEMTGRLHESFSHIQQFSAEASHELRTPLTIMRGEIDVALRNARLTQKSRDLLNSIHDELVRLSSIVENLMTLVNSESGRMIVEFSDVALESIISEAADNARILASRKKIKVSLSSLDPVTISGDPQRLRQLFLNLVDNAVKFTPPHGRISLGLERLNGRAIVSVKDSGIGIPRRERERVFDRFYRVQSHKQLNTSGSGLGLSIAKWIAEAHDGTINVKGRETSGSTFIVTLPAKEN